MSEKTGLNSVFGASPSVADFVTEAASSDMFEIQSSELALQRAADAPTKSFAAHMIADHRKTTAEITGLLQSGEVRPACLPA